MAFEKITAEINLLLSKLADPAGSPQQVEFQLHERLSQLKALGLPLPQDLIDLDATLDRRLRAEAEAASRLRREPPRTPD